MQINKLSEDMSTVIAPVGYVSVKRRSGLYRNVFKRIFDLLFIIVVSVAALPLIVVLAALVALDGHNPFYMSDRVGRNGRTFRMLKLRTMVPDADALLEKYLATHDDAHREWNATQKLKCDPRTTRVGRFLRKVSLDELPQLWNVLIGNMSLVGPRPMMPSQRPLYPGTAYYALRPGITGLWQVSVRNEAEFAGRAEYDRLYDDAVSFTRDVRILYKTMFVVFKGTGY
jgi:lipopolysaccharide/colanic/teichoic acid biosynthesis glycosyltransferase